MTMIQAFNDYCKKEGIRANGQYALEDVMPHFEAGYKALLAELSKDAEPSAFAVLEEDGQFTTWDYICGWPEAAHEHINEQITEWQESGEIPPKYSVVKLYERPANTAEIEQRVAEACATFIERTMNTLGCHSIVEATIAEKDAEIAQARNTAGYWKAEHIAGNQLIAEQQAHIEVLREALEFLNARIVTMDLGGVVEKALAIQSSTDALREHDAKLVERIADRNLTAGTRIFLAEIAEKIRKGEF